MNEAMTPDVAPLLLAGLEPSESRAVIGLATSQEFCPDVAVCRQAEPGEFVFVVRSGRVRFARTTPDGGDILLRWLDPGECFGLASLVPGPVNYMATGVTTGNATLYVWEAAVMQSAAATYPRLAQNALRIALLYLEEIGERHAALLSRTAEQRLARAITHLGATKGTILPTGVDLEITNHDLAGLSDVGMYTVSRQLKCWERDGHLVKRRQHLLLRHPEALLAD